MAVTIQNQNKRKAGGDDRDGTKLAKTALDDAFTLKAVDEKSIHHFTCSICLELLHRPVEIIVDGCHHMYCSSCLSSASRAKQQCPQCRRPFAAANILSGSCSAT